jgi:hypothetical protein
MSSPVPRSDPVVELDETGSDVLKVVESVEQNIAGMSVRDLLGLQKILARIGGSVADQISLHFGE